MAKSPTTAVPSQTPPSTDARSAPPSQSLFRGVYRFLASLKLAVFSLSSLSALLAYATFFESWYGTEAARAYVYRSPIFFIVNMLLFANIFCAATIRYPWKKHQIGFVVTHIGLLTLIVGSFISQKFTDDGQVGLSEGETSRQLIRTQQPVIRVRVPEKSDSGQTVALQEYELDIKPGVFPWKPGRTEQVTRPKDPFSFEVIGFLPEAQPRFAHESTADGLPMIDAHLLINAPNQIEAQDILSDSVGRWLKADARFGRVAQNAGPATIAFQYIPKDDSELADKVADFLNPPKLTTPDGTARLHYLDKSGKKRTFDWVVDGALRKEVLPESDLTVEFLPSKEGENVLKMPTRLGENGAPGSNDILFNATGEAEIGIVRFKISKGTGPGFDHYGWPDLVQAPSLVPGDTSKGATQLARVAYLRPRPPGSFGYVEVLGTGDDKLYYRVFGREGFRKAAELKKGDTIEAFSGGGGMAGKLRVDNFLPSGSEKLTYVSANLPVGQKGNGLPAIHCKMTAQGTTKEFWVRRSPDLKPLYQPVRIDSEVYEVAYDVDRKDLDFEIKLVNFEAGVDPGTEQASSFESQIELTDSKEKILGKPITISMNNPLIWRGYTFYQSNYIPATDENGRRTGDFISVFQVRHDRVWGITYMGCLIIVTGIFLQFYMRSGPFKSRSAKSETASNTTTQGASKLPRVETTL
ncbi:MAG: cytochrome c biogenesis protein ResB [Planctomycetota bacterium]|nr:cytochrome c biogenesis protein ResB [Planctomycetota bacterium]